MFAEAIGRFGRIDVVVSNCVLNLVREEDRRQLFQEIFRVLRRGGRAVISDIVCDEAVPPHLKRNPELWTGCMSGAFVARPGMVLGPLQAKPDIIGPDMAAVVEQILNLEQ